MSEQTAAVESYSEEVGAIVKELEAEARSLVPQFVFVEAKCRMVAHAGTTESTSLYSYKLRSENHLNPDPVELIGPTYDLESKKLSFQVRATYGHSQEQNGKGGIHFKGIWFSATVEKDCDLIPGVVSGVSFPGEAKIYCRRVNGWGVFVTREELEQIQSL